MAFPDNFITELVDRSDIVDVVSAYVRLGKKSGSNMFGLCPFHSEKTPSFSVSPDKQIYHCFGCGKGGGVINFIMDVENLNFPEAVEFLARRAGMPIPEQTNDKESKKKARMLALNKEAARFFYAQLTTPEGQIAVDYMKNRRISPGVARNFGIGYAPNTWDSLRNAMKEKGFTDFEMFDAGLVRKGKNGGFYDCFRSRLMFPVIDVRGDVIGFSGRILGDGEPKYMNSPETAVFNKTRNLFALNLAKKSKCGYIILSEGNIDVVSLHQAGFDSAVASLGTSLTPEQARLISRYTDQVVIAYDNDNAGIKATQRAIGILEKLDLKVKVLKMSGAKDPDEFIKLKGADAFRNLLEASENQIDYRMRAVRDKYDLDIDEQKVEYLKEATELVARLPGAVEREVYGKSVAETAGVADDVVLGEVDRLRKRLVNKAFKGEEKSMTQPEKQAQPKEKEFRFEDPGSAAAEKGIIRLLYWYPELGKNKGLPDPKSFSSSVLAHIYTVIRSRRDDGMDVDTALLSEELSAKEIALLVEIIDEPRSLGKVSQAIQDYIDKVQEQAKEQKIKNDGKRDLLADLADRQKKEKDLRDKYGR